MCFWIYFIVFNKYHIHCSCVLIYWSTFRSIIELWGHGITHEDLFEDLRKSKDSVVIYSYSVIQVRTIILKIYIYKKEVFSLLKYWPILLSEYGLLFIFQMSHLMDTASFKIVVDGFNKSLPQKYKVQRIEVCILFIYV